MTRGAGTSAPNWLFLLRSWNTKGFLKGPGCPRLILLGWGSGSLYVKTEFPAHLLLTPSGGQTGSPAAARRGRGSAARQMAAFTYSWEPLLRPSSSPWRLVRPRRGAWEGGFVLGRGNAHTPAHRGPQRALDLHRIHTQLHLWTSQTQSQSHKPTHTGIHKELRIFIVFTRGCIHGLLKPSLIHIQAPSAIPTLHSLYHTCTQHKVTGLYGYTGSSINTHAQRSIYTATQSQSVTQSRSRVHV